MACARHNPRFIISNCRRSTGISRCRAHKNGEMREKYEKSPCFFGAMGRLIKRCCLEISLLNFRLTGVPMEKRKNRRVHFEVVATVLSGPISIDGTVDNLSMKGMFLNTRERLSGDSALKVSMTLPGSSSVLSMELKGR